MCQLADEGPQRLGVLASAFGLDASTITRQVQVLEAAGLAEREKDRLDGRAYLLHLTLDGREVLKQARDHRRGGRGRGRLERALSDWPEADLVEFGRLLKEFNASIERLPDA